MPRPPIMPMGRVALIRNEVYRPFLRFLTAAGVPVQRHLERTGVPLRAFERREALLPLHQVRTFLRDVARAEGIEHLGLEAAHAAALEDLGAFGAMIRRAPTVRMLLESLLLAVPSYNSGARWWIEHRGDSVTLCHVFLGTRDDPYAQAEQFALATALKALRLAGGPRWRPLATQLAVGPSGARVAQHALLVDTPLRLDPRVSAITFEPALLARPLAPPTRVTPSALTPWGEESPASRFADLVGQAIESLSAGGAWPSIAAVARALGLSVRTLQRWLAGDGQSFDDLIERSRLQSARDLLEHTDARVLDIALDLGYSDHAHFTRAFRRWTGVSPLEYRRAYASRLAV
ncbi:MAG: helix-turn-helix domain-containing protein [bacterium]|nr:helix-turn-helix domain-containing protein [bacterium]